MANKIWLGTDTGNEGDWSVAANFSPSGVPTSSDKVWLTNSTQSVTDGLDQSSVTLAEVHIDQSYTGSIGTQGSPLQIGADRADIGEHYGFGTPAGSQRINLDIVTPSGAGASTIVVHNTCTSSADSYLPPVRIKTANAGSTLQVLKGYVGLAVDSPTDTATIGTVTIDFVTNRSSDANVEIGEGVTMTTLSKNAGACTLRCAATTVTNRYGELTTTGSGAIGTMNVDGGDVIPKSSGTITTLDADGGTVDFTRSQVARTVTNASRSGGATIKYDQAVATFTNGITSDGPVALSAA